MTYSKPGHTVLLWTGIDVPVAIDIASTLVDGCLMETSGQSTSKNVNFIISTMVVAPLINARDTRLNVLDLPSDVLTYIFTYFERELADSYGRLLPTSATPEVTSSLLRDTQNVRLVCRVFHELASPYLLPVLPVSLEKSSLDTINSLIENPFVLKGIRLVEILTMYRPKEFAQSLALFKARRLADLDEIYSACDYYAEVWYMDGADSDDETVAPRPKKVYDEASNVYDLIRNTWNESLEDYGETVCLEKTAQYEDILVQSHMKYQKRHEEQWRLITDGSLVDAIATLVSRVPRPCSVEFTDSKYKWFRRYTDDPTVIFTDMDQLSEFMTTPHDWDTIERISDESDLVPSTLLTTLPLALRQHGATVHGFHVNCFPRVAGHYQIDEKCREPRWDGLRESCRQLKSFDFGSRSCQRRIRLEHPRGEDKTCIDRYFGAMLSNSNLEYIHLNFYSYGLNDGRGNSSMGSRHMNMDMGSVISLIQYPLLRKVQISNISIQQIELEKFCRGLGERLQSLHIREMELSGHWVDVLDILHRKFSTSCRDGRCEISLISVYGGEFGWRKIKAGDSIRGPLCSPETSPLIVPAEKFINGSDEVVENPLRWIVSYRREISDCYS